MYTDLKLEWNGEACLSLVVTDKIEKEALMVIQALSQYIDLQEWSFLTERVPSYSGLTLYFDVLQLREDLVMTALSQFSLKGEAVKAIINFKEIEIPVCYGLHYGPDLEKVAAHTGLSVEEVISKHTEGVYLVYMIGFMPGFAYMGGMDETLSTPRLEQPRLKIEAGAVGIAGQQTGIYPLESPGGWNIIGQTPLKLFDPEREKPSLLEAGMTVRFKSVTEAVFLDLKQKAGDC